MQENIIPTDIITLGRIGAERISDICWPVTDEEFSALIESYVTVFEDVCLDLDYETRGLFLADYSFCNLMGQISHALLISEHCKRNKLHLAIGPLAKQYYQPDWHALSRLGGYDGNRMLFYAKGLVKDLMFNQHLSLPKRLLPGKETVVGIGSMSRLKSEYAALRNEKVRHYYLENLIPRHAPVESSSHVLPLASSIIGGFSQRLRDLFGVGLDCEKQAIKCWGLRLGILFSIVRALKPQFKPGMELWATSSCLPHHKAISLACRLAGGKSVAFHHGNHSAGIPDSIVSCYNEYSSYDVFISPTQKCADLLAIDYSASKISQKLPVDFVSVDTHLYSKLVNNSLSKRIPATIQTVMLMGFPMHVRRDFKKFANFFIHQIIAEICILQLLKKNNYTVLYKIHPERQEYVQNILRNF